jgi:hypothetical protein
VCDGVGAAPAGHLLHAGLKFLASARV